MKTVTEMAREAGLHITRYEAAGVDVVGGHKLEKLEAFAAPVREDERESIYKPKSDERLMKMPVAEVFNSCDGTEFGGNKSIGKTILPYKSINTLNIGTKLYTAPPTAALPIEGEEK